MEATTLLLSMQSTDLLHFQEEVAHLTRTLCAAALTSTIGCHSDSAVHALEASKTRRAGCADRSSLPGSVE